MALDAIGNTSTFQEARPVQVKTQASTPVVSEPVQIEVRVGQTGSSQTTKNGNGEQGYGGKQATEQQMKLAVLQASKKMKFGHTNAQFSYHEDTKRISIKIIDDETKEVIKEIPPEETLEMISKMWELIGLMVDEKR